MTDIEKIIYTFLALIIVAVLAYFLFKIIIKEIKKEKEDKNMALDGVLRKSEMNSLVATYMNKMGSKTPFTLIYIDLDKFEDFVLAFGEKESKKILKQVVSKIKKLMPKQTYLSRYKGDEFLLFVPTTYNRADSLELAQNLLEAFRERITVFDGELVDLTASIALVQYPNHGETLENLLESLELTIYQIKKNGGNQVKVYTQSLLGEEEQMNYYYQIKKAISKNEFMLYYQPMIDIVNNKVYAIEALLRWEHPEHGVLAPNKFITIMEQSGDIHWVGQWGFEKLVNFHLELRKQDASVPLLTINLSPKQLMNKELVQGFNKILRKYKVDAKNFVLEIGEFTLFEKQELIIENLEKLTKLGFLIAIDGMGIDIKSFDKITALNIDIIKIEYDFIKEESFAVDKYMEVLNEYSKSLNKIIICQGIEEEKDEDKIKKYHISYAQGYYYSKPLKNSEIRDYLQSNN